MKYIMIICIIHLVIFYITVILTLIHNVEMCIYYVYRHFNIIIYVSINLYITEIYTININSSQYSIVILFILLSKWVFYNYYMFE